MSGPIIALRRCITHQTRSGRVRLCAGHEGELIAYSEGGDKPAWRDALGLAEYLSVHRGYGHRDVCDACKYEALAAAGLLGVDVGEQPWNSTDDGHALSVRLVPVPAVPKADAHYVCADEGYGPADPYAGVEDFLAMCDVCFGCCPELQERADGDYYGADGIRVLERRQGPAPY